MSDWRQAIVIGDPEFVGDPNCIDLVIVGGDTHINSTRGLRPPQFIDKSKERQIVLTPQVVLDHLWKPWLKMWRAVKEEKARLRSLGYTVRVIFVFNGDGPDHNKNDKEGFELITREENAIKDLCEQALVPATTLMDDKTVLVDLWVFNRGTEKHEGGSGALMEGLAERMATKRGANVIMDGPSYSHWCPRFLIQGVDAMFMHHPIFSTTTYQRRRTAAARTADYYWRGFNVPKISMNRISYERETVPDVMFFGHTHYDADGGQDASNPIHVFYVASWQLPTAFVQQLGYGAIPNAIGCRWMWCQAGGYYCKPWLHRPPAKAPVSI